MHRQSQQTQDEPDIFSMDKTASVKRVYESLTADTEKPPADDDAGSCYDVIPHEPETYEALRDGEDTTGTNNIQEQQPTRSSPDDEVSPPEPPPPRDPMYLELLDDEGKAPDVREDIDTSSV